MNEEEPRGTDDRNGTDGRPGSGGTTSEPDRAGGSTSEPGVDSHATHEPHVIRADSDGIATLTLNRPAARNPLSLAMLEALESHLADVAADTGVRVVVITAEGPAFSAGHDLRELRRNDDPAFHDRVFTLCSTVMQRVASLPQPVVAKVGGVATAAGCQLVASCDMAIAGRSARFATPGVNIGLFCSTPAVAVSRAVLPKHAMQLLLTGEMIDADDAHRMGLVNQVVNDEELGAATAALAALLASKPPSVVRAGKAAFRAQVGRSLADAYESASAAMVDGLAQPDAVEGIAAFLDKRAPNWITPCGS